MLQTMRDNLKGTVAVIIIGFMMIPFVFFGIDFLAPPTGQQREVAEVNGEAITEYQLQNEVYRERNRLMEQFGNGLPEQFLSDENLRGPALERLIERELLKGVASEGGMRVPEAQIAALVRSAPQFQEDGRYSQELYGQFLRAQQMTHAQFMAANIEDRVLNQLVTGVVASDFITDKELQKVVELSQQKRDFQYLTIPVEPIASTIEISDESAQDYYQNHKDDFLNPEQVSIQFISLSLDDIQQGIQIPEAEVREAYEAEVAAFDSSEERHAAHILIESKDDGSEQHVIKEVQDKLAAGEDFAALAEQYSDDLGSRGTGGDLGFTTGDTFPEPFETALANLEVGAVSAPVETESGFHIIKLLEVRGAEPPTFEEDRARIERALKAEQASDIFLDMTHQLEDLSYNAEDLSEVAKTLNLNVQQAGPFSRSGGLGIASDPAVVDAAFSDEVLVDGNTSPLLELAGDRRIVLRVTDHQQPRTLNFDEVKTEIVRELTQTAAQEQVAAIGADIKAEVEAGKSIEEVAKEREYEWQESLATQRTDAKVPREVLTFVFGLPKPEAEQTVIKGTNLVSGDYVVANLTVVKAGSIADMSEQEKANLQQRLARMMGESSYSAFKAYLEERADIERNEAADDADLAME